MAYLIPVLPNRPPLSKRSGERCLFSLVEASDRRPSYGPPRRMRKVVGGPVNLMEAERGAEVQQNNVDASRARAQRQAAAFPFNRGGRHRTRNSRHSRNAIEKKPFRDSARRTKPGERCPRLRKLRARLAISAHGRSDEETTLSDMARTEA